MSAENPVPDKSDDSAFTPAALGNSQLLDLVHFSEQALALIDPHAASLVWCSEQWQSLFPEWSVGTDWNEVLRTSEQLAQLYQSLKDEQRVTGILWCQAKGDRREFVMQILGNGLIGLRVHKQQQSIDDMHVYMQAREHMFTTSRTISVSEMATTLAHEIKQPIATISNILKGMSIRLKRDDLTASQLEESLGNALEQAQFTNSVINRIRDFTQSRRPQQQALDVVSLIHDALSLMDWLLSANQCAVELSLTDQSLRCQGDPTMLQQVLVNLLRNGVEAMQECQPDSRILSVTCKQRGTFVRVSIHDRGHGLEGKEQSLFIPFSTSKATGMGVGLNICRSFVELHQGRLWLSPNDGGGCTAHVELPLDTAVMADEDSADHQTTEA
jgi:signal transduction histidine kinase